MLTLPPSPLFRGPSRASTTTRPSPRSAPAPVMDRICCGNDVGQASRYLAKPWSLVSQRDDGLKSRGQTLISPFLSLRHPTRLQRGRASRPTLLERVSVYHMLHITPTHQGYPVTNTYPLTPFPPLLPRCSYWRTRCSSRTTPCCSASVTACSTGTLTSNSHGSQLDASCRHGRRLSQRGVQIGRRDAL